MTAKEQRKAAGAFAAKWAGRGYEKGECQKFWRALLHDVYNNFPWPGAGQGTKGTQGTEGTRGEGRAQGVASVPEVTFVSSVASVSSISATAQAILDARALYPDSSLADLYDPLTMPPELRKAHQANDAAVLAAYGFPPDLDESAIVSRLFEMYAALVEKAKE